MIVEIKANGLIWSPDCTKILTAYSLINEEDMIEQAWIQIMDSVTESIILAFPEHANALAWSPTSTEFITGGIDGVVRRRSAVDGSLLAAYTHSRISMLSSEFIPIPVTTVAWNPVNPAEFASAGFDNAVRIWNVSTGAVEKTIDLGFPETPGLRNGISWVEWNADGGKIACAGWDGKARIYSTTTLSLEYELAGHKDQLSDAAWSPNSDKLATASADATICIWDTQTGKLLRVLAGHSDWIGKVSWSPDGRLLASASPDGSIRVWEVLTGQQLKVLVDDENEIWVAEWGSHGKLAYVADAKGGNTPNPVTIIDSATIHL